MTFNIEYLAVCTRQHIQVSSYMIGFSTATAESVRTFSQVQYTGWYRETLNVDNSLILTSSALEESFEQKKVREELLPWALTPLCHPLKQLIDNKMTIQFTLHGLHPLLNHTTQYKYCTPISWWRLCMMSLQTAMCRLPDTTHKLRKGIY